MQTKHRTLFASLQLAVAHSTAIHIPAQLIKHDRDRMKGKRKKLSINCLIDEAVNS